MSQFLKQYGDTEWPLGIPMKDKQAQAVEQILKALPAGWHTLKGVGVTVGCQRQPHPYRVCHPGVSVTLALSLTFTLTEWSTRLPCVGANAIRNRKLVGA
jgi:hypothetical protein